MPSHFAGISLSCHNPPNRRRLNIKAVAVHRNAHLTSEDTIQMPNEIKKLPPKPDQTETGQ
jgi:hypothetical protein